MTKEIFTLIAGLVIAFISATTVGISKVFSHPANLFAILFLIVLALVAFAEDKDADAKRISTWLKRRDGPMLYTRSVQGLMRTLERLLMPGTAADEPMPDHGWFRRWNWLITPRARDADDLKQLRKNPWSWPVYDAALKLAILYPILLAMGQWVWTGEATGLGAVSIFPAEPRNWLRYAMLAPVLLVICFGLDVAIRRNPVAKLDLREGFPPGMMLSAYALAAIAQVTGLTTISFVGVLMGAAAMIVVLMSSGALATGTACAIIACIAGASVFSDLAANIISAPIVVILLFVAVVGSLIALGMAAAIGTAIIPGWYSRQAMGGRGYAALSSLLLGWQIGAALLTGLSANNPIVVSVWLFLGLLPLLNAVFDWLSYGLTIWLIRNGNRRKGLWTLVYGLIDAVSAMALFFALSLTLTCVIGWTNAAGAVPVLNLDALFADLSDPKSRGQHFWVAGMIFSTLVPTAIHLGVVALSAITWIPPRLRAWCEAGIGQRHDSGQAFTVSALVVSGLYAAYSLMLTWGLFKLAGAVLSGISAAIPSYLRIVEACARTLGAM